MSFIEQKAEDYGSAVSEPEAETVSEFVETLKTSAKEDAGAIKAVHDEVAVDVGDDFTQDNLDGIIEDAVTATLKWVGVY